MPWRLVAIDLDGTVLDAGGCLLPGVVEGLGRLRGMGIPIVVATGRSVVAFRTLGEMDALLEVCDHEVLVDDADTVLDRGTGEVRCVAALPAGALARVAAVCPDYVVTAGERLIASSRRAATAYAIAYQIPRHAVEVGQAAEPVGRVTIFGAAPSDLEGVAADTITPFAATVLRAAHGGKATGIAAWLRRRVGGVSLADVIAIGDGDNDALLLASSGVGIAVRGSSPAAAAAASVQLDEPLGRYLRTFDPRLCEPVVARPWSEAQGTDRSR